MTAASKLTLSPNPATSVVNLTWEGTGEEAVLTLINAQGKAVQQQVVKGHSHQLQTSTFSSGLYVVSAARG